MLLLNLTPRIKAAIGLVCFVGIVPVEAQDRKNADRHGSFSLASNNQQTGGGTESKRETTSSSVIESESSWEISGPVFLRSADPEPPGELVIKNIFGWETSRGSHDDDDFEYELELEYGLIENHELIFEVPVEIGDGHVNGNADITLGWHWRLWKEQDILPAFAMRNFVRLPSGVDSSGVDYEWRGLFTKTVIPETMRLHLNPFVRFNNGDNEEDEDEDPRDFRWGAAFGTDYRLSECLLLVADYIYSNSDDEGVRDNHVAEVGLDWKIDDCQKLGFAVSASLDGDSNGSNLGARISYMYSFGGK